MDLSGESNATRSAYGVDREDPPIKTDRAGGPGQFRILARNCLLARRLVERGVRFVNLFHASLDHHSNLDQELPFNAGMADQPIAARCPISNSEACWRARWSSGSANLAARPWAKTASATEP